MFGTPKSSVCSNQKIAYETQVKQEHWEENKSTDGGGSGTGKATGDHEKTKSVTVQHIGE